MNEDGADGFDAHATPETLSGAAARVRPVKPRAAASMVLIDASGSAPKVLLGRRHPKLAFLPSKYVFPGGKLEIDDRLMAGSGTLPDQCSERLALRRSRGFPGPQAFALAAIRETFEETGLLLGTRRDGPHKATIPLAWQAFTDHGFAPDLAPLRFIGRAVTPPSFPRRFDTSFFAVDIAAVAHRIDGCVTQDTELVELVWLSLDDAAKLDIPRITAMILLDLATRIAANFDGRLPVPLFYERNRRWIREEL
ncbi:MAG: NUDIX hydrolase [Methylovirgula sp.]